MAPDLQRKATPAAISALNRLTASPGPSGWAKTPALTAKKSAPAWARARAVSTATPPMATQGVSMLSCQMVSSSGSARVGASLVAAVVTGHADNPVPPHQTARLGIGRVFLAHMHPVAAQSRGKVRPVIQDQSDIVRLG
jgi:hypothetical protein